MLHIARQRLSRVPLLVRIAGLYACLVGFAVLGATLLPAKETVTATANNTPVVVAPTVLQDVIIEGTPLRLVVERLGVDLTVRSGEYNPETLEWTLDDVSAFFATVSRLPNNKNGTTFIYGHNRPLAFSPLQSIQVGDTVDIYTDKGVRFRYIYQRDAIVTPDMTKVLYEPSIAPQLILMTCDGVWNEVRRTMYFSLAEVRYE